MMRFILLLLGHFFFLQSCSKPVATDAPLDPMDLDMVSFAPGESLGYLGFTARTQFSYSFSLSKAEITQAEFSQAMGYNPVPEGNLRSPQKPVVLVSFYEAVLFSNAASKLAGYDTVYSYTSATFAQNRVQSLEGLSANYAANGYRLPTEAEWEYAARDAQGSLYPWGSDTAEASAYAWSSANAGGVLHTTCSLHSVNGLCDMAGNAMEWVDGWHGDIPADTLTDFIGAASPNSSYARIVKGGMFRSDLLGVRTTQRTDVYATNSATRTEYLGFRIAQGSLSTPSYQSGGKASGNTSALRITASKAQVQAFFGTASVRLVLADGINDALISVNFAGNEILPLSYTYSQPVRLPTLSPDGNWIVFADRGEGQSGISTAYMAPWHNPTDYHAIPAASIAVPRWKVLPSGDTVLLYTETAGANRDSLAWATEKTWSMTFADSTFQSPELLYGQGGFHDGLSNDGRWLVTSYTDLRVLDRNSNTVRTLFRSPANGKDVSGSTQACNASVRPGINPEIMLLDFGYEKKSALVGRSYRSHEYLFFMNPATGQVTDYLQVPKGYQSWDYPEWSNDSNFIIATVVDSTEMHAAVYAIRRSDHAMLKLMEGTDLWSPQMLVKSNAAILAQMDPRMFRYDIPTHQDNLFFASAMMLYWKNYSQIDLVVLGSSRSVYGIEPSYFRNHNGLSLAMSGADHWAYIHYWEDYLRIHSPQLKWVVMEMSLDFLLHTEAGYWKQRWALADGYQYDLSQSFYAQGFPTDFSIMVQSAETQVLSSRPNGSYESPAVNWGEVIRQEADEHANGDSWLGTLAKLDKVLADMASRGIRVVGVIPPQSPKYQDPAYGTPDWGRYGPSLAKAAVMMDSLHALQARHANFRLLDQHLMGKHDYTDADAQNCDHLASTGAAKLSTRIDSVMRAWE